MIKFRIYDKKQKKYITEYNGFQLVISLDGEIYTNEYGDLIGLSSENFVLEQSTSITDKNGNEIYIGDVLKANCLRATYEGECSVINRSKNDGFVPLTQYVYLKNGRFRLELTNQSKLKEKELIKPIGNERAYRRLSYSNFLNSHYAIKYEIIGTIHGDKDGISKP